MRSLLFCVGASSAKSLGYEVRKARGKSAWLHELDGEVDEGSGLSAFMVGVMIDGRPSSVTSRAPWSTSLLTSSQYSAPVDTSGPRVVGTTQKEQNLLQPQVIRI